YLAVSGMYWGLTALDIMHMLTKEGVRHTPLVEGAESEAEGESAADTPFAQEDVVSFVMSCYQTVPLETGVGGGFGGAPKHDVHTLYTMSALQLLALYDSLDVLDVAEAEGGKTKRQSIIDWVCSLQLSDGSFSGDASGECDSRLTYTSLAILGILGVDMDMRRESGEGERVHIRDIVRADQVVGWLARCQSVDGGFSVSPGDESHGGQAFVTLGALSLLHSLSALPSPTLASLWLAQRQMPFVGGFNGRPSKKEDVCYSWWVGASLSLLSSWGLVDGGAVARFILRCQDTEDGGIADRPENRADAYHTMFGVAALSLIKSSGTADADTASLHVRPVSPAYCMPVHVCERLGLTWQVLDLDL
ncbi:geranylgeranyl transferase type-2 subunit beta, partial [Kipferlia bialata]